MFPIATPLPLPVLLYPPRREYGARRMHLVLLGGEPLDTLQAWVGELFGEVPCGPCGKPRTFGDAGMPFEVRLFTYVICVCACARMCAGW